jgi:MFS superfamily sulfate permease-like transporter
MDSHDKKLSFERNAAPAGEAEAGKVNAAFQARYASRDAAAGLVTGTVAIPLTVGIAMMSDYPIQVGLATVVFASLIGWLFAWFRPGNYIGSPGIAAGLAPVLALGVASFGIENMAFCIFLTAIMQAIIWKFNWQRYLLVAVPIYLVEGLLAGVGLTIFLKFFSFSYEISEGVVSSDGFWNAARIQMLFISGLAYVVFVALMYRFRDTQPAIPYFVLIIAGVIFALFVEVPMLHVEEVALSLAAPIPQVDNIMLLVYMVLFCAMLAVIDVIEQVMSNAAIEKIDPLERKCNSNNSLLAIWVANLGASFFGGMTNLDGLAKSTTNKLAGAYTKFSVLVVAIVVGFFTWQVQYLEYLPMFTLAVVMMFTGYKMVAGLLHVAHFGPYPMVLAILCGGLVYQVGIFEGLLIAMAMHAFVHFVIYLNVGKMGTMQIVRRYIDRLKRDGGGVN